MDKLRRVSVCLSKIEFALRLGKCIDCFMQINIKTTCYHCFVLYCAKYGSLKSNFIRRFFLFYHISTTSDTSVSCVVIFFLVIRDHGLHVVYI